MNRGIELLGAWGPRVRCQKNLRKKRIRIRTLLGVGGLRRFPDPVAGRRAPKPHLRSQYFGLSVYRLGAG